MQQLKVYFILTIVNLLKYAQYYNGHVSWTQRPRQDLGAPLPRVHPVYPEPPPQAPGRACRGAAVWNDGTAARPSPAPRAASRAPRSRSTPARGAVRCGHAAVGAERCARVVGGGRIGSGGAGRSYNAPRGGPPPALPSKERAPAAAASVETCPREDSQKRGARWRGGGARARGCRCGDGADDVVVRLLRPRGRARDSGARGADRVARLGTRRPVQRAGVAHRAALAQGRAFGRTRRRATPSD